MLQHKRVVVTGAAGALGQAVTRVASGYGAIVIGLDLAPAFSSPLLSEYVAVDLRDRAATSAVVSSLGRFDGLVNVAGGFAMGTGASEDDDSQWQSMFELNVDTMRNATIAAVPLLKANQRSSIVNIGAFGALSGAAAMSAYCCAKGSVMKLTESLSEELKADGININAVLPSIIDTPTNRAAMPDADFSTWVTPDKLAEVICFLLSDAASAVHGALLPVKGLV